MFPQRNNEKMLIKSDFIRDKQMAKLYEKFVLNFFCKNLDEDISEENLPLLPEMRTDIVVENKAQNTQLIIDTKFYSQTLSSTNWSDIEKIRTSHLFQILAYVNNSNFKGNVRGMLLYPTIEKEINADFSIGGKKIAIRTLNLNTEWNKIAERLLSFVE